MPEKSRLPIRWRPSVELFSSISMDCWRLRGKLPVRRRVCIVVYVVNKISTIIKTLFFVQILREFRFVCFSQFLCLNAISWFVPSKIQRLF
jgi:hypothetical protein